MELYTLYVGQGALAVLVGEKEALVIDAHLPSAGDADAVVLRAALPKLLANRKLIGLILTSFDADHADVRAVSLILGRYLPRWVMYPTYWKDTKEASAVMAAISAHERKQGTGTRPLVRHSIRLDRMSTRVLDKLSDEWNFEVFSPHPENMTCSNNCSLVTLISPKWWRDGFKYLVTGDTETERWDRLTKIFKGGLGCDVMAAPHHGADTGFHPDLLKHAAPKQILISAGVGNQFGHPDRAAHAQYSAASEVFSTHDGRSFVTKTGWFSPNTSVWEG